MNRTLFITNEDIAQNPVGASITLLSVMLYPEDKNERVEFIDSWVLTALNDCSTSERADFIQEESLYVAKILDKQSLSEEHLNSTLRVRKAGGFSKVREGVLAGHILLHLLNPNIGTLEGAYAEIINRFDLNLDQMEKACNEKGLPPSRHPKQPSKPKLREVWGKFKHVSHLWATEAVLYFSNETSLFSPVFLYENHEQSAKLLRTVLGVGSFLRNVLVESYIPSTSAPHIKNGFHVWNIINEENRPYQPISIDLKKF